MLIPHVVNINVLNLFSYCYVHFKVLYLPLVICFHLSLIPLLSTSHGVHHSLYLVQLSLDITYQLLVMEQLLTTLHQTVIMCYS